MFANVKTVAFKGIEAILIDTQVHIAGGIPAFNIVGLPDKIVAESKERIRAALNSIGLALPPKRITVNLAPANIQKEGSHYDVPISLGLLVGMDVIPGRLLEEYIALGELSLDGSINAVSGVLPASIEAVANNMKIICPEENGPEALWANADIEVVAPSKLADLISHLKGNKTIQIPTRCDIEKRETTNDMQNIKGQEVAKRALEVTAAGRHHMLMIGPPGNGKSMLAKSLPGILPDLTSKEILEISMIMSITNNLKNGKISRNRPFREPHHSCSMPAMVGGGRKAQPGEITLAHNGVLFLDELPEFPRQVIDSLRQPIESNEVTVSRAHAHITYPAKFQLISAMNPCRCGYLQNQLKSCSKAPRCGADYQGKISGPMLDRIDIIVEVPEINPLEFMDYKEPECSQTIKQRVVAAREIQEERYKNYNNISCNSDLNGSALEVFCKPSEEVKETIKTFIKNNTISIRNYSRLIKIARTIADLGQSDEIKKEHVIEAILYKRS